MAELGEDDLENCGLKVNANELLAFQRDLKQEKELLQKILTKIDDQVHRLQVEQLHVLGIMNKTLKASKGKSSEHELTNSENSITNKSLDLSVATTSGYCKEEIEDEDEDDI